MKAAETAVDCKELVQLLPAYIDNELGIPIAVEIDSHLMGCAICASKLRATQALMRCIAEASLYYRAPTSVRDRVAWMLAGESRRLKNGHGSQHAFPANVTKAFLLALTAAIAVSGWWTWQILPANLQRQLRCELVASHLRSLEANHLLDVKSTDQHSVNPWFAGKLDFAAPVEDLTAEGFPLLGCRLDYVAHRAVAAVIYRRDQHIINLFMWPDDGLVFNDQIRGFSLVGFKCHGMVCWAVSDLSGGELENFTAYFTKISP